VLSKAKVMVFQPGPAVIVGEVVAILTHAVEAHSSN
jgi:hypothetical protein